MNVAELKAMAAEQGIEHPSSIKKADLVALLNEYRGRAGLELLDENGDAPDVDAPDAVPFDVPDVRRGEYVDVHVPGSARPELGLVHSIDEDGLADLTCFTDAGHGGCYGRHNVPCLGGPAAREGIATWSVLEGHLEE